MRSSELTRSVRWDCDPPARCAAARGSDPSELTRSVRWDCDHCSPGALSSTGGIVGADQISTVGWRRTINVVHPTVTIVRSELTRSVRWDCDASDVIPMVSGPFPPSELTRSVRWDCDMRSSAVQPAITTSSELTRSVRWDCDSPEGERLLSDHHHVGADQISMVGLRRSNRL